MRRRHRRRHSKKERDAGKLHPLRRCQKRLWLHRLRRRRKLILHLLPGTTDSLFKAGRVAPAQVMETGYLHQLCKGCAIGLAGIKDEVVP